MKSVLILILSCVPLTVLTVWTFVGMGSVDQRLARPTEAESRYEEAELAGETRARVKAEKPIIRDLSEAGLFAAEPIPALENPPDGSSLGRLGNAWPEWVRARRMVSGVLGVEQLLTQPKPGLEQLKEARGQLEALKAEYEKAPPQGAERLLNVLDRRHAALNLEIIRLERQREALALVERARSAFRPGKHGECVELCDRLLGRYVDAIDVSILAKVRTLKVRAQFWTHHELLSKLLGEAETPSERAALLRSFLDRYSNRNQRTEAEIAELEECERNLRKLEEEIENATRGTKHSPVPLPNWGCLVCRID